MEQPTSAGRRKSLPQPEFRHLQPSETWLLLPALPRSSGVTENVSLVSLQLCLSLWPLPGLLKASTITSRIFLLGKGLEKPQPLCQELQTFLRKGQFHFQNYSTLPVQQPLAWCHSFPTVPVLSRTPPDQGHPNSAPAQHPRSADFLSDPTRLLPGCQSPARAKPPASLAEFCKRQILGERRFLLPSASPGVTAGLGMKAEIPGALRERAREGENELGTSHSDSPPCERSELKLGLKTSLNRSCSSPSIPPHTPGWIWVALTPLTRSTLPGDTLGTPAGGTAGGTDGQHVPKAAPPGKAPRDKSLCKSLDKISAAPAAFGGSRGVAMRARGEGLEVWKAPAGTQEGQEPPGAAPGADAAAAELWPRAGIVSQQKIGLKTQQNQAQPSKVNTCYFFHPW